MQSASHGHSLVLCTPGGLTHCVLLHLDHMIIPGLVIVPYVVISPDFVIIHDLDWHAGIVLLANSDTFATWHDAFDKQEILHTKQCRAV